MEQKLTPEQKQLLKRAIQSRHDFSKFAQFILRDEEGRPWSKLYPHQLEWIDLILRDRGKTRKRRPSPADLFNMSHVVIWAPTDSAKTELLTVALPVWLLGRNPNLRILLISNTSSQASKFVSAVAEHINANPRVKLVFPHLKPQPSDVVASRAKKWTEQFITVEREVISKDFSVSAYGVGGAIMNARADVIIVDDVLDLENTRSQTLREYTIKWLESSVLQRLVRNGFFLMIGTAWHPNDAMHVFSKRKGFTCVKYSYMAEDQAEGYRLIQWDRYPPEQIEKDMEIMGPVEFARSKRCKPVQSDHSTFEGLDNSLVPVDECWNPPTNGLTVSMGVDISASGRAGNAIAVVGFDPKTMHRTLLEITYGRWTAPVRNEMILETFSRWESRGNRPIAIVVENNGIQEDVSQWLVASRPDVPVIPFTTGRNKVDPVYGLPGFANEFYRGLWSIPTFVNHSITCTCNWCRLVNELREHPNYITSDGVMALWFATKVFIQPRMTRRRLVARPPRILIFSDEEE